MTRFLNPRYGSGMPCAVDTDPYYMSDSEIAEYDAKEAAAVEAAAIDAAADALADQEEAEYLAAMEAEEDGE